MKRIVFLTLFCYVLASLSAQIPVSQDIRDAISNYDYEKALNLMKEEPATIPLLYLKGKALKELGRDKEALEVFHLLTIQDSLNPRAYIEAGECYKTQGKYQPALKCYRRDVCVKKKN